MCEVYHTFTRTRYSADDRGEEEDEDEERAPLLALITSILYYCTVSPRVRWYVCSRRVIYRDILDLV